MNEKIEYKEFHKQSPHMNTMADHFVFVRSVIRNSLDAVVPLMAGITKADRNYFINLEKKGFDKRNFVVIEYVVSGSGYINCNGIQRKVTAGDFYMLGSEFSGSYSADPKDPYVKKWVNLNGQLMPALLRAYGIKNQVFILHFDAEKHLDGILDILSRYDEENYDAADRSISHILIELFADIRKQQEMQIKELRGASMADVERYVESNLLQSDITVESLSNMFYISRRTLHRMFIKEIGVPPLKYITAKKIELAQKMLAENMSVEAVSRKLHFSGVEYFRKVFVSVTGCSPQKYKMTMQKKS